MTINIRRGLLGEQSPAIAFVGLTSDKISSASYLKNVDTITAEIGDGDTVNIIDEALSLNNGGGKTYELFGAHYSEFRDVDGAPFSDPVGVVSYISDLKVGIITAVYLQGSLPLPSNDTVNATVGVQFSYDATKTRGVSYFWDESTFPNGVDVSRYDRRKISGIITQTGSYTIDFDVANGLGTRPFTVEVVVS